jgi:hypothetical protein
MKRLAVFPVLALAAAAAGPLPSGEQVMRAVNSREVGRSCSMQLQLLLRDRKRGDHIRQIEMARRATLGGYDTVYRVVAPAYIEGIVLLISEAQNGPGLWMYFPYAKHLLHIATRGLSALTSDFSCEDLRVTFALKDYIFANQGVEKLDGVSCYRIEMRPREERIAAELGFERAIGWVRQDIWSVLKADYFDSNGVVFKTFRATNPETIQGVITFKTISMENYRADHKSEVQVTDVKYGVKLDPGLFVPERLPEIVTLR